MEAWGCFPPTPDRQVLYFRGGFGIENQSPASPHPACPPASWMTGRIQMGVLIAFWAQPWGSSGRMQEGEGGQAARRQSRAVRAHTLTLTHPSARYAHVLRLTHPHTHNTGTRAHPHPHGSSPPLPLLMHIHTQTRAPIHSYTHALRRTDM